MAEFKTIKSKKISTSATSTTPRLGQKRLIKQDHISSVTSRKCRSVESRPYADERKWHGNKTEKEKKVIITSRTIQTESKREMNTKVRTMSYTSLGSVSHGHRQSQIPVRSRLNEKLVKLNAAGPVKKRETVVKAGSKNYPSGNGRKTTLRQPRRTNNLLSKTSRSPLILRQTEKAAVEEIINGRSKSSCSRNVISGKSENKYQYLFSKKFPIKNNSAESNINATNSYTTITLSSPRADESDAPIAQSNRDDSSAYTNEELSPTQTRDMCDVERTMSLDALEPTKNEESKAFQLGDLNKLTENDPYLELLDLSMKDSESQLFSTVPGSAISSVRRTSSNESEKLEVLRTPLTTIRTLSGDELVIDSSIEFDIENEAEMLVYENNVTVNDLLKQTEDSFIALMIDDDVNEYDSNVTSDDDSPSKSKFVKSDMDFCNSVNSPTKSHRSEHVVGERLDSKTNWRFRENELLTDVNYRQFVYHPTVLRRQTGEELKDYKERHRSKSTEARTSFRLRDTDRDKDASTKKNSFKDHSQALVSYRDVNITPLRAWSDKAPPDEDMQIYDSLQLIHNTDYLKETKRYRSKRERITSAVLGITAKFINILAILNLWPGDNCQLVTTHSLRYRR